MTTTQDGGKVVSLTHWPPLPQGWVDPRAIVRSEGIYVNEKFQWHQLGFFFIFIFCLHGFFRHNRARYPPTRLACDHKTWNMKRDGTGTWKRWSRWMPLGLFSRVGAPSYSYHPGPLPGPWHHIMWSAITWSCTFQLVVTTVILCLELWGNSRHSYACSATDTTSIWIVSGSPWGRVKSDLVVGLVGTLQIGIAPTVPRAHIAEARGRIVGAATIRWGFSPESCTTSLL